MAQAVELKWFLALQERQSVPDGAGGFTVSWVTLGQLWAHVEQRGVSTTEVSGGDTSKVRYRITVRSSAANAPSRPKIGQRLRGIDAFYLIDSVHESDASGQFLHIWANEEVLA